MAVIASKDIHQEYKDSLKTKAEELVMIAFPRKILELKKLLEIPLFGRRDYSAFHEELNIPIPEPTALDASAVKTRRDEDYNLKCTRMMVLPSGMVPCNKQLRELSYVVKPHIRQLMEDMNLLKMWIILMIPKIEDGNNFGVSVQKNVLAKIQSVESEAASFRDKILMYFRSRGKIVSMVTKYPNIEDYRCAVKELDEKQYLNLLLITTKMHNRYSIIYDIVIKNLEKIKMPRNPNTNPLY